MQKITRKEFLIRLFRVIMLIAGAGGLAWFWLSGKRRRAMTSHVHRIYEPRYLKLHRKGELRKRGQDIWEMMQACHLCPRMCAARRLAGQEGFCQASAQLEVASYHPHFGEERPLVGRGGSGTIFFTHCSLRCVFCINAEISHGGQGRPASLEQLAGMMLDLQGQGCHNINVVTPTHYLAHILLALDIAASRGLQIPLVYNTSGWERLEVLNKLDGVVDIYLPDFKYFESSMADRYSAQARDYPEVTQKALLEMHRQVGVARPDPDGLMRQGLMIRHLVMPNNVSGSSEVIDWIAQNLPKDTYVNIMSQYRPYYRASEYPQIARPINSREYAEALRVAQRVGLTNVEVQGL